MTAEDAAKAVVEAVRAHGGRGRRLNRQKETVKNKRKAPALRLAFGPGRRFPFVSRLHS